MPISVPMGGTKKVIKASRTGDRVVATQGKDASLFDLSNISALKNPLKDSGSGVSAKYAIDLCQKAYQYVPIFRNTIEIMTEFSNAPMHFKGKDKKSVEFFTNWYKKINSYNLADQFFRELNRSTNIFLYKMEYKFSVKDIESPSDRFLVGKSIPVRYSLLDPSSIKCSGGSSWIGSSYFKILSRYEMERLKNPKTDAEKNLLRTFSDSERKAISQGGKEICVELSDEKLIAIFGKKQDYEPLSTPMFFPVLSDINLKLEFKKADLAISKTTDYLILLLTMGAKKADGGTDPKMLQAMQELFANESVGRVLIADYTTKGEFLIPDLNQILGKGKYEAVNQDIAQGMMNIFFENDQKFSNSLIKIKVFMERLRESRRIFKDNFLIPEMERLAKELGLKEVPTPVFEKVDLEDTSQLLRAYTRLAEIGFLTPEEFFDITESGIFPEFEDSKKSQEELVKLREKGMYTPFSSSGGEAGRPSGTSSPKATSVPEKLNTSPSVKNTQQKSEAFKFSEIEKVHQKVNILIPLAESEFKNHFGLKRLSRAKKDEAFKFVESVVIHEKPSKWKVAIKAHVAGNIPIETPDEILEISDTHELPLFQSAILFHSIK